jgi:hypothetical protein
MRALALAFRRLALKGAWLLASDMPCTPHDDAADPEHMGPSQRGTPPFGTLFWFRPVAISQPRPRIPAGAGEMGALASVHTARAPRAGFEQHPVSEKSDAIRTRNRTTCRRSQPVPPNDTYCEPVGYPEQWADRQRVTGITEPMRGCRCMERHHRNEYGGRGDCRHGVQYCTWIGNEHGTIRGIGGCPAGTRI